MQGSTLVGLDYGGTLDNSALSPREKRWSFYREAGYEFPKSLLRKAHVYVRERILASPHRETWQLATAAEKWLVYEAEYLGLDANLARQWAVQDAEERLSLLKTARPVVRDLSRDYPLVLISNNIGNLDIVLTEAGLRDFFCAIIDSSECGYRKPDPNIFYEAQRQVQVSNSPDCWYLGNSLENDALAARNAGWRGAWLVRSHPQEDRIPQDILIVRSIEHFHDELNQMSRSLVVNTGRGRD